MRSKKALRDFSQKWELLMVETEQEDVSLCIPFKTLKAAVVPV